MPPLILPSKPVISALALSLSVGLASCDRPDLAPTNHAGKETVAMDSRKESVMARVKLVVAELLGRPVSEIAPRMNFVRDLGADSLDAVEIVMALEEEFEISIDDASAEKMHTVLDVVNYVEQHAKP